MKTNRVLQSQYRKAVRGGDIGKAGAIFELLKGSGALAGAPGGVQSSETNKLNARDRAFNRADQQGQIRGRGVDGQGRVNPGDAEAAKDIEASTQTGYGRPVNPFAPGGGIPRGTGASMAAPGSPASNRGRSGTGAAQAPSVSQGGDENSNQDSYQPFEEDNMTFRANEKLKGWQHMAGKKLFADDLKRSKSLFSDDEKTREAALERAYATGLNKFGLAPVDVDDYLTELEEQAAPRKAAEKAAEEKDTANRAKMEESINNLDDSKFSKEQKDQMRKMMSGLSREDRQGAVDEAAQQSTAREIASPQPLTPKNKRQLRRVVGLFGGNPGDEEQIRGEMAMGDLYDSASNAIGRNLEAGGGSVPSFINAAFGKASSAIRGSVDAASNAVGRNLEAFAGFGTSSPEDPFESDEKPIPEPPLSKQPQKTIEERLEGAAGGGVSGAARDVGNVIVKGYDAVGDELGQMFGFYTGMAQLLGLKNEEKEISRAGYLERRGEAARANAERLSLKTDETSRGRARDALTQANRFEADAKKIRADLKRNQKRVDEIHDTYNKRYYPKYYERQQQEKREQLKKEREATAARTRETAQLLKNPL